MSYLIQAKPKPARGVFLLLFFTKSDIAVVVKYKFIIVQLQQPIVFKVGSNSNKEHFGNRKVN